MDLTRFKLALVEASYRSNDILWMPKYWTRFLEFHGMNPDSPVFVREHVVQFSRSLKDVGVPAWQRHQAVNSIQAYVRLVLKTGEPDLSDMLVARRRVADREGNLELNDGPDLRDEAAIVGVIDPNVGSAHTPFELTLVSATASLRKDGRGLHGWLAAGVS